MQVETFLFGSVEVSPENIITFPKGVVAFEDKTRFTLIHETEDGSLASFTLQSVEDPNLAFQIIDPAELGFNYELSLNDEELAVLQNPSVDDVAVMLMLFKQEGDAGTIAPSIRAPLILNTKAKLGLQKVIVNMRRNITISNLAADV